MENKVVIVTGASSGIGAATAIHFASLGAHVSIVARNKQKLEAVQQKCVEAAAKYSPKLQPLAIVSDVTTDSKRIIAETIKTFGKLDVLVNNAGIGDATSLASKNLMDTFDKVLNTNVRSIFELTQLAVPHLIKTKGNIVNVSSVAGTRAFASGIPYCVSKAALDHFTKCTSLELAPKGVRVNSINPALIEDTDIFIKAGMPPKVYEKMVKVSAPGHPMQRNGQPEECAAAIAFLASDQASFTTGAIFPVDGGRANLCESFPSKL